MPSEMRFQMRGFTVHFSTAGDVTNVLLSLACVASRSRDLTVRAPTSSASPCASNLARQ